MADSRNKKARPQPDRGLTRREFIRRAGLVTGGALISPLAEGFGCSSGAMNELEPSATLSPCAREPSENETVYQHFVTLDINGHSVLLPLRPDWTLDFVLRDKLGLFGTKVGCDAGDCGSCVVLANGVPVLACLMLAIECEGLKITTIEGLSDGQKLHPVQQRFYDREAFQCGFCTPGFIMAAVGLLNVNPSPTAADVRQAFSGHICTCGNLARTINAVVGGV